MIAVVVVVGDGVAGGASVGLLLVRGLVALIRAEGLQVAEAALAMAAVVHDASATQLAHRGAVWRQRCLAPS